MKNSVLTFFLLATAFISRAQLATISGNVADEVGPLPGAQVSVKGTARAVQSDFDGNFMIQAKKGEVLLVRYIGYKDAAISIKDVNVHLKIVLEEDAQALEEVVVVAICSRGDNNKWLMRAGSV